MDRQTDRHKDRQTHKAIHFQKGFWLLKNTSCLCVFVFCHFRMALKSLLDTKSAKPYFRPPPLRISVLKMIDFPKVISWFFSTTTVKPAITKFNKTAVVSDEQTCTKVTLFQQFAEKIKEGFTYIMKGHNIRRINPPYFLNITERTMFYWTTPMTVSQQLHQQAKALLCPRSPLTPLHECHTSEGLITLEGKVVEASFLYCF